MATAQEDSLGMDSTQVSRRFFQPALYLDYGKLLTVATEFETKYEAGLELMFLEKYVLYSEIGHASLNPANAFENGTYESTGLYYRVGAGYVSQFTPKNKIGLSFRYASASFEEEVLISLESPSGVQDTYENQISQDDLSATWYEVVLYSDRKLSDLFSIGLNLRLRILASYDEQPTPDVYAIPGYGRSFENTVPAANFFFKVSF